VLNRILRHNLRNSANVILGHTTRLLDQLDEQTAEMTECAAAVEAAADDLEASNIDAISRSADDDHVIDCVPLVLGVARERRQRAPHAEVETVVPDSMDVCANTHLQSAIESLVDNAIRHHTMDSPHVRIRVEQASADDWVSIHVEDNNHEIPTHEREIVTGKSEVTELNHGTGLGLWLARWTVDAFGGHMSFGTSDLGGNDICLRLPRS
jgi:signal transduction histidine kinase